MEHWQENVTNALESKSREELVELIMHLCGIVSRIAGANAELDKFMRSFAARFTETGEAYGRTMSAIFADLLAGTPNSKLKQ